MASKSQPQTLPARIDVHSHFLPPFYRTALEENGHSNPDGMPAIPEWSVESHLAMMAAANVTKSILSISSPGTHLVHDNPSLTVKLARDCNAYAASLKRQFPDKFGYWATLPLPDAQAALDEIDRAVEEGADGFSVFTNYFGEYLGSAKFGAVWKRLDSLEATVFVHPTKPCIHARHTGTGNVAWVNGVNEEKGGKPVPATPLEDQFIVPMFEFLFDTARAVINLFGSRTVELYPTIRYIIPHAGGCLPPLWTRFVATSRVVPGCEAVDADWARKQLEENFYFDLAGWIFDGEEGGMGQLKGLVEGLGVRYERLLIGTDFPFTGGQFVREFAERNRGGLEALFGEEERIAIYEGNAKKLLENATWKQRSKTAKIGWSMRGAERVRT